MKLTKEIVETYTSICFEQPLKNQKYLREEYIRNGDLWECRYSSNSTFHLCPYDGQFRDCKSCGIGEEDFDTDYCLSKQKNITTSLLLDRITKCQSAGVPITFY